MIRCVFAVAALLMAGLVNADAHAGEQVAVCHGYGCLVRETVVFSEVRLDEVRRQLLAAGGAAEEREWLASAIGQLYAWAGEQTDIHNDKGGNLADDGRPGRMDCIDHSTTTTRLLRLLEARGALRWHRVREPEARNFALIFPAHYAAVIESIDEGVNGKGAERFVVDSWFVDNGQPAVILPLEDWKKGAGPDV